MSTTTAHPALSPVGHDLRFTGVLRAEWIKLRSIRSTWWAYAILVVLTVGLGAQMSASLSFQGVDAVPTQDAVQDMAVYAVMVSTDVSTLIVSVLGVLIIAGEYGTGMIRSTLTAVPKRLSALLAKALVFVVVTFVVSAVAFAITVPISVGLFAGNGFDVALDDPHYWLALLGGAGYLVLVGLIAFGIGALLRNTAGGIAVAVGLVLAAPLALSLVLGFASSGWVENVATLLPSTAGSLLFSYPTEQSWVDLLPPESASWLTEPWQGALVLVAWAVVLFTAAAVLLKRRDA
ncbi:ABC transporter permease [Microbacterium sp. zg-YB36]|uniref:ABC transporter permease n=1 Tax=Microbacterium sp. zg-YB36 TaxID=2969407 RepID=UPI00214CE631|nr:ABC transporter permease [Microbacterium sp. zg-YB36]MDL5350924.1 ABC transporter permease [Microbacterium sp. zg-YB36]